MLANKYIHYDHTAKAGDASQTGNKIKLHTLKHQHLPKYITDNKSIYSAWIDSSDSR